MKMLHVKLDSGREVWVEGFFCEWTYANLVMGSPNEEINQRIIEHATAQARTMWNKRVHLIEPIIDDSRGHPDLPDFYMGVSLVASKSVLALPELRGSRLVAVWFHHEFYHHLLAEVIREGLKGISWEELAENFAW